jgi:hypothetical protein
MSNTALISSQLGGEVFIEKTIYIASLKNFFLKLLKGFAGIKHFSASDQEGKVLSRESRQDVRKNSGGEIEKTLCGAILFK